MEEKSVMDWDKIATDVEAWGEDMLFGEESRKDGWKEVKGWSIYNKRGVTKCYLKWMPDSRGEHAEPDENRIYPCIRIYSTVDAPLNDVCSYLADESHYNEYNVLVVEHKVLEELGPDSKICWGLSPQILFITPRDFVSFCSHRWKEDGTQVVVSQACDHPDAPAFTSKEPGKTLRAYSLRGANFLSADPEDPTKTKLSIVSQAYPGKEIPHWLSEQGVNVLAPIEAFKLMHNINKNVQKHGPYPEVPEGEEDRERSQKPAGMAMMGYAAFWPNGGGLIER